MLRNHISLQLVACFLAYLLTKPSKLIIVTTIGE